MSDRSEHPAEYRTWSAMQTRCHNPNHKFYPFYGGRGIAVAQEWRGVGGFARFLAHIGPKPSSKHSIDRIDNTRGYEPGNVRWVARADQYRNRTDNINLTFNGRTRCVADWAAELGISASTIYWRFHRGLPVERVLQPSALHGGTFR